SVAHGILRAEAKAVSSEALQQSFRAAMSGYLRAELAGRNACEFAASLLHDLLQAFGEPQPDGNSNESLIPDSQRFDGSTSLHFNENGKHASGWEIQVLEGILDTTDLITYRRLHCLHAFPERGTISQNAVQQSVTGTFVEHLSRSLTL
ncbi:MAG TPA: hypothetical protein VI195_06800, partial [Steroidobacteraceae bacterium]